MSKTFFHKRMNNSIVVDGTKLLLNDYDNHQTSAKQNNEIQSISSGIKKTNVDSTERKQVRAITSIENDRIFENNNSIFNSNTDRFQS